MYVYLQTKDKMECKISSMILSIKKQRSAKQPETEIYVYFGHQIFMIKSIEPHKLFNIHCLYANM